MFYENFVAQCSKKELSPSAAAEKMGYKRSVVTRWKNGTAPRAQTLLHIASFFGCSVEDLTGEDKPVLDEETLAIRQAMRDNPDLRILFDAGRGVPKSAIYEAAALLLKYKENRNA